MGVNLLGERKLRAIRRHTGESLIDRAAVFSHVDSGRYVWLCTSDHRHGAYDRRTAEVVWYERGSEHETCFSSCERFPDYRARRLAQLLGGGA